VRRKRVRQDTRSGEDTKKVEVVSVVLIGRVYERLGAGWLLSRQIGLSQTNARDWSLYLYRRKLLVPVRLFVCFTVKETNTHSSTSRPPKDDTQAHSKTNTKQVRHIL
jgi:hypothetical protein